MSKDQFVIDGRLGENNRQFYSDKGYLIAPGLLSAGEVDEILEETYAIFRGERGSVEGLAETDEDSSPAELLAAYNAIHFPHKISPTMLSFVLHPGMAEILTGIVSRNVKCMQSMLFVKAPGKPGQSWHQDEFFIPTRDRSLTGAWIAVDDADTENGCLWVIPGSHKDGYIRRRIPYEGDQFADVDVADIEGYDDSDAVPVEVRAGSVVFFNGYLLHASNRNKTSNRTRIALVNHYMSCESQLPWSIGGRLDETDDMRDVVVVAGDDPYDWKGVVNVIQPYLRPDVLTHRDHQRMKHKTL